MADWQIDQMTQPAEDHGDFEQEELEQDAHSEEIDWEDRETLRDRFEARLTRYDGSPR